MGLENEGTDSELMEVEDVTPVEITQPTAKLQAAKVALKQCVESAKTNIQAFPGGQWSCKVNGCPLKFEVTQEGYLNEIGKSAKDTKTWCQLVKHTDSPWHWASEDGTIEMNFVKTGKLRITTYGLQGKEQLLAVSTDPESVLSAESSSAAWYRAFSQLLHHATVFDEPEGKDEVLLMAFQGVMQLFKWVCDFCNLLEECSKQTRAVLMQDLAKRCTAFIHRKFSDVQHFTHVFIGTALLTGLCLHWPKQRWDNGRKKWIEVCVSGFGKLLEAKPEVLCDGILLHQGTKALGALWDQLSEMLKFPEVQDLPHWILLKVVVAMAEALPRELPLQSKGRMNLEYLLLKCVVQHDQGDLGTFEKQLTVCMGSAAKSSADPPAHLAESVVYLCKQLDNPNATRVLCIAHDACSETLPCGAVIWELCRKSAPLQWCIASKTGGTSRAAKDIFQEIFRPLLQTHMPKVTAMDLQRALSSVLVLQLAKSWTTSEVLMFLEDFWARLSSAVAVDGVDDGKREFLHNFQSQVAIQEALKTAWATPGPRFLYPMVVMESMTCNASGWMKGDVLCDLSLWLMKRKKTPWPETSSGHRICLNIWQQLMSSTATASQFDQLLDAAIKQLLPHGMETYKFLRVMQETIPQQEVEIRRQASAAVAAMKPRSLKLLDILGTDDRMEGQDLDWLSSLFLECWIPSVMDVPSNSPQEKEFFQWLADAPKAISAPHLVRARLQSRGALLHPWLAEVPCDPNWAAEWPSLEKCCWPKLEVLVESLVGSSLSEANLPPCLSFFLKFYRAAADKHLPRKAYTRLADVCQKGSCMFLLAFVENMDIVLKLADVPAAGPVEVLLALGSRSDELKIELQRQMQLLEWLVAKWGFQEIAQPRAELKRKLSKVDDLSLLELEREVQSCCEIFQCLDEFEMGAEMFAFLQHFMRSGSALVKPLLEHFASVYAKQQGQWSQDAMRTLDFYGFCQVVLLCHRDLRVLAVGSQPVNMQVWQLLVAEFLQKNTDMRREINLLLGYFLQSPESAQSRQQLLVDAFRIHRIAASLPDLLKALQLMKFDWALQCELLQRLEQKVADLGTKEHVNVVEDAAKLKRVQELGISDQLKLSVFETLLQRVCVYDFFVERGFTGPECMTRFQETLNIVQQSLEQDEIAVRQALLDELRHCAEVLRPFLIRRAAVPERPSEVLLEILQNLAERNVRLEAFDRVAENLKLIGALFDSVHGTGSQLLLFSLRKILEGDLVILAAEGGFCCSYPGVRGEEVIVPSSSLSEYSVRSLMSLEGRDPDSDEALWLKKYIRQMEAIVSSHGLVSTSKSLHEAGHPDFRTSVRIPMTKDLLKEAEHQKKSLEWWKKHVEKMLRSAPILGLVPRGQLHAWLAEIKLQGLTKKLLRSLTEGLRIWNDHCTEEYIRERLNGTEVSLERCCSGLKVQLEHRAKAGRFMIREEQLTEEGVLLLVVQLFLQWLGGPKRLPRPSEVLFCSKNVALADVEAFLWRSKQFPELLFVLVEPNHLAFEGKSLVADWLAAADDGSAVVVILTAPWHIPSSSHVQPLKLKPDKSVVPKWKEESTTELTIYSSALSPHGAGVSSGKSTWIQKHAEKMSRELVPCILHEGFQLQNFVSEVRKILDSPRKCALALHIDLSAYSDPVLSSFILRHLFLCGVLYDPSSGEMVYIPAGTHVYVEVGAIAGKRDIHSLKAYITEESLQAKFPKVAAQQLDIILLYPILSLLGKQMSGEIQRAEFQADENHLNVSLRLIQASFPWETRQLQLQRGWMEGVDLRMVLPQLGAVDRILTELARQSGVHGGELARSRQKLMVRRISILSEWMVHCPLFTLQDPETLAQLGFLLMECMVVNLCQLHMSEEPCIHFVPTYTKTQQDHFCLFLPSLVHVDGSSSCSRGSDCRCNDLRQRLSLAFPGQVWVSEAPAAARATLPLALEDERQSIEALSHAFGIPFPRLQEILRLEGYILTRDFACKILELLARRKSRVPVILVGESGVGKTRALEMMTRLLLESDEVKPPIVQGLYGSYMRRKLVQKKEQLGTQQIFRVEQAMNSLLEEGFTLQGLKELLKNPVLYEDLGEEALFTRKELVQYLVRNVRESQRFEIGLLHLVLQNISAEDHSESLVPAAFSRSRSQWEALGPAAKEDLRSQDTVAMICRLVGDEEVRITAMSGEIDLTEEDTTDVSNATLELTLKLVALLPPQPMFFRVQVHAAMTAMDIHKQLEPAFAACLREPDLTIVVFLDEVNTASCLGLIKAMLFDGIYGRYQNLFLVAAANPYREETAGVDQVLRGGDQVMRDFFQVHPLPPSFSSDIWNWRSPTVVDEECYAMLQLKRLEDLTDSDVTGFARAIAEAQRFMRTQLASESAVSQRDILRVIRVMGFFRRRGRSADEQSSDRTRVARAMLLAFAVCYYLGLNSNQRERFNQQVTRRAFASLAMEERCGTLDLPVVLQEETDIYMKHVVLPPSIAMTRALKENVFAVIVGIECRIPVMIVGMPGTGKTLAVNIATAVLRGSNAMPFFRDFCDVANSVFRYQCSKESTSRQIHEVFENASRAKQRMDLEQESQRCPVVFIDEAGLPEERTESLKAIHYWIDRGEIFCCLLANKPLDAAKRNRCLQIFRDEADGNDLQLLASECLGVQLEDPSSRALVQGFCKAFEEISRGSGVPEALRIFHLRDFHHCLRYLRRNNLLHSGSVAGKDILRALQRNFGGLPADQFRELVQIFFKHLGEATDDLITAPADSEVQPTIDVLREALQDLPPELLQDADFEPCRYKLLIDATEDGGALRLLQSLQLIPEGVTVLGASSLEGEQSQLHRSKTVSSLRRAAEQPKICVVSDFDEMLDGFYDMLNLRFQRIPLKDRIGFAATIAAGSWSVLAPVHPRFQLLVCIKAVDVKHMPLPFLNRFEKYFLGPRDLACHRAFEMCNGRLQHHLLEEYLLQPCRQRLDELVQLLGMASLVGCTEATLDSACCEAMDDAKDVLAKLATVWQDELQEPSMAAQTDVEMVPASRSPLDLQLHAAVRRIASAAAQKLLQLAPSETLLQHMASLPMELLKGYTERPHTGLASLLQHVRGGGKRRSLIFTRDTLQTPSSGGLLCTKELSRDDVEIHPIPRSREEALELFNAQKIAFASDPTAKPLLILCRLDHGTARSIHHLRRIADEVDAELLMTVLLPPWRLHVSLCYEAVFLGHWNIFHLDTLDDAESPSLVSSILCPVSSSEMRMETEEISSNRDEQKLLQDCWAAVARLPLTEIPGKSTHGTAGLALFYSPHASLRERVEALWSALKQPEWQPLLAQLLRLRSCALQGVSLQREAVRVAQEIIGIAGEKRPMSCLQSTVRQRCAEHVVSALVDALHALCDQGGLLTLVEQGDSALALMVGYLKLRVAETRKETTSRPLTPACSPPMLPCFGYIFNLLQECVLNNAPENFDLLQLVESTAQVWSKHRFRTLSQALLVEPIGESYCQYVAQRFGFPPVVACVLHAFGQQCDELKRLPATHAFAWCHRSDLAALGFLYQEEGLPKEIREKLQRPNHQGALLGDGLAACMINLAECDLKKINKKKASGTELVRELNSWHHSFEALRATLSGRLPLPSSSRDQLQLLNFFSDLIPLLIDGGGLHLLDQLMYQVFSGQVAGRAALQKASLKGIADLARQQLQQPEPPDVTPLQSTLQRLVDDMIGPLHLERVTNLESQFEIIADLLLEVVDQHQGFFQATGDIVTPAMASAALTSLLEVIARHSMARPRLMNILNQIFSKRLGEEDPGTWIKFYTQEPAEGSLSQFLYFSFRSPHLRELLELPETMAVSEFTGEESQQTSPFLAAWRAARKQRLLEAVVQRSQSLTPSEARELAAALETFAAEEGSPLSLLAFLDEAVKQLRSATAAGKAVKDLQSKAGIACPKLEVWADALMKPELAASGPGEDPWNDLPRATLPGFEGEKARRRRRDGEQQRQDELLLAAQNSRCCPRCKRVIQKNDGCDTMLCGRHAHDTTALHGEGCGHQFSWSSAPIYQPTQEAVQLPPGFSAISEWLEDGDFQSPSSCEGARRALQGLSEWDRRYAVANACACRFFKQDQSCGPLARVLLQQDQHGQNLRAALALEDQRLAKVVAVLCDASQLPKSKSLASAALLGRDCWEESSNSTASAVKLRHALVNLLVTVVGSPDNNHLWMLLLEPCSMFNSYPVGFVYGQMPGPEGYHFDCGCVLDQHGRMQRVRAPLENTHLHFLNFCSWAMLSLGLLIFPENCQEIDRVLSLRYIEEVDPSATDAAEKARSYSMNFAVRCFECVCLHQGLSFDDRGLCFSKLFESFRLLALGEDVDDFGRCFSTAAHRRQYEEMWRRMIDEVLAQLPLLQKEALEVSGTQRQLLQLTEFREKKNYMQRFFHSFEACTLAVPGEPDLSFITLLLIKQDELAHLPLLGQIVQIQNWIYDRLNGCLPLDRLDMPLIELLQRRRQRDEERGHHSNARRCQTVQEAFKKFLQSWHHFYEANRGEIPVECQVGRQQAGLEVQQTRLAKIEDGSELPLRFFLSLDSKCQPMMVAEYLCRCWNEIVTAASNALHLSDGHCAKLWAARIQGAVPVWLADLFIQEQLAHTLNQKTLRRALLRNLRDGSGVTPRINWKAAQQEILTSHLVHRIQKLDFPQLPPFVPKRNEQDVMETAETLAEDVQEKIRDTFAQMSPDDLAKCRAALTRISSLVETMSSSGAVATLLEAEEVQYQVESTQLKGLLEGLPITSLPCLRRLAEEESGEFRHLSPVLKAKLPDGVNLKEALCRDWGDLRGCASWLAEKDKLLRETITNLESENFCHYLMDHDTQSLATTYEAIYLDCASIDRLPSSVLGCHAVAVLQCLRELLRDVRARKSSLDQQSLWDPGAGLQPLPREILDRQKPAASMGGLEGPADTLEDDWWEVVPDSVSDADAALNDDATAKGSHAVAAAMHPEAMLGFMARVCGEGDLKNAEVEADANLFQMLEECRDGTDLAEGLERFLDIYQKQLSGEKSTAWQEALGSRIRLSPLESLLSLPLCRDVDLQKTCDALWSSMDGAATPCLFPRQWQRFVQCLAKCGHSKLEAAVSQALGTPLPAILRVPSMAEKEVCTRSNAEVLLNYEGQYFQVLPLNDASADGPAAKPLLQGRLSSWLQKTWRFLGRGKDPENAPPEPKKRRKGGNLMKPAIRRRHEEERLEDRKRLRQGVGTSPNPTEDLPSETVVSVASDVGRAGFMDRFELMLGDLRADFVSTLPEFSPKVKCSESFQTAMRSFLPNESQKVESLRAECRNLVMRILQSKGSDHPFGLEKEELFALVCYSFDIRHKFPDATRHQDFSVNLRQSVRERQRDRLEELGAFMHHLMKGLAKMKTPTEGLLYSMIAAEGMEVKVGQTVELPTFTSWYPAGPEALEAFAQGSRKIVSLRTKTGACDLSEILQCNVTNNLPEMVLLPSTMLRVVNHSETLLELEEVTDGEDDF